MAKWQIEPLSIRSEALELDYSRVPWDEESLGVPIAQISHIRCTIPEQAPAEFKAFESWMNAQNIQLCSVRIPHSKELESFFLQSHGFRFVELNYSPQFELPVTDLKAPEGYLIDEAQESDIGWLIDAARHTFQVGRFHNDPRIGEQIGNHRYARWMQNSLADPNHQVVKIIYNNTAIGFFVFEYMPDGTAYWWLNGILQKFAGQGHGKNSWKAIMSFHQLEGASRIRTSISSQNVAVMNLYATLGFRFPEPSATLHFIPRNTSWGTNNCT